MRPLTPAPSLGPHLPKPEAHQDWGTAVLPEEGHGQTGGVAGMGVLSGSWEEAGRGSGREWRGAELTSWSAVSAEREHKQSRSGLCWRLRRSWGAGVTRGWRGRQPAPRAGSADFGPLQDSEPSPLSRSPFSL